MGELLGASAVMLIFFFCGGFLYKYRGAIKRYVIDPKYGTAWRPTRKRVLEREIEDAQDEITWLEEHSSD